MTIIQIEPLETGQHPIQSQSHRHSCWLEGWIAVPKNLEQKVWDSLGYCNLIIENNKLIDIEVLEKPSFEKPQYQPTEQEQLRADIDYLAIMAGVEL